ncbi:hypothetical protein [Streptomyces sp. NPDC003857]
MGGQELGQDFAVRPLDDDEVRAASVHVADRIGLEHPHQYDGQLPGLAGRLLAHDPVIAAGIRELLEALGLPVEPTVEQIGKRIRFAGCFYLAAYRTHIADLERELRAGTDHAELEAS